MPHYKRTAVIADMLGPKFEQYLGVSFTTFNLNTLITNFIKRRFYRYKSFIKGNNMVILSNRAFHLKGRLNLKYTNMKIIIYCRHGNFFIIPASNVKFLEVFNKTVQGQCATTCTNLAAKSKYAD